MKLLICETNGLCDNVVYECFVYGNTCRSVSGRSKEDNLFYSSPSLPSVSTDRTCKHGPHSDVRLIFNFNHFNFGRQYDPVNSNFGTVSVGLFNFFFPKNTGTHTETVSKNSCSSKVSFRSLSTIFVHKNRAYIYICMHPFKPVL